MMDGETKTSTKMGRPKREEGRKVVYFVESTFHIWNDRKKELSPEGHIMTSNEFAIFLLKRLGEGGLTKRTGSREQPGPNEFERYSDHNYEKKRCRKEDEEDKSMIQTHSSENTTGNTEMIPLQQRDPLLSAGIIIESTPVPVKKPRRQIFDFSAIHDSTTDCSPLPEARKITNAESTLDAIDSTLRFLSINEGVGELLGDPLNDSSTDSETSSDTSSLSSCSSTDSDSMSTQSELSADNWGDGDDDGLTLDEIADISNVCLSEQTDQPLEHLLQDMDINRTFVLSETELTQQNSVSMDLDCSMNDTNQNICQPVEGNTANIRGKIAMALENLFQTEGIEELGLVERDRIVVSVEKLKELKGSLCKENLNTGHICNEPLKFQSDVQGTVLKLRWSCGNGHLGVWVSSEVVCQSRNSNVYLNDLVVTACVLLSGNSYVKFADLCSFLNLAVPNKSSFCRNQRLYFTPVILSMWNEMRCTVIDVLGEFNEVVLGGDGRNDSPGFSARFCVYVMMDIISSVIVDMEVLDKRETGGVSGNMEREGMTRILLRLKGLLDLAEIATDASSSIIKRIKELKDIHPALRNLVHSLDIWHKAKSLSKRLHKAAKEKDGKELKPWIEGIVNHFWFSCEVSAGDVEKLKDVWFGVIHHVCNEHVWVESQCLHGPLETKEPKSFLDKNSKSVEKLRSVVFDPKFLSNIECYTKFRHTGAIENFNSMLTKYAPKRLAFDYPYFLCRIALAVIDHNMHIDRKHAKTKEGKYCYKRKYNKSSRKYHAEPVKEKKDYKYVPYLLAKIVELRKEKLDSALERVVRVAHDPKLISPNLDFAQQAPPTRQLVEERMSRKESKKGHK